MFSNVEAVAVMNGFYQILFVVATSINGTQRQVFVVDTTRPELITITPLPSLSSNLGSPSEKLSLTIGRKVGVLQSSTALTIFNPTAAFLNATSDLVLQTIAGNFSHGIALTASETAVFAMSSDGRLVSFTLDQTVSVATHSLL